MLRNNGRHNFRSPYGGVQVPPFILDFAGTQTLNSGITFSRSSPANYYNSSGVLTTAATDTPRFTYNPSTLVSLGLLEEQSSTNLVTYSRDFSNAAWAKSVLAITPNLILAPDGSTTGTLVTCTGVGNNFIGLSTAITTTSGTPNTKTIYFKAGTATVVGFGDGSAGQQNEWGNFNLSTGVATAQNGATASMVNVGNGWYRCSASLTGTGTLTQFRIWQGTVYPGTGGTGTFYIWEAQLEKLSFPTSPIFTTTTAITRAADLTPLTVGSWYGVTTGSVVAEFITVSTSGTPRIVGGTPSSKALIELSSNAASMFDGSTTISTANTATANITQKIAATWDGTNGKICLNAGTVVTGSQANGFADLTTIGVGYNSTSNNNFINGTIAKISFYNYVLSSAQMQILTGL